MFHTGIDEHEVTIVQFRIVFRVMQNAGIVTAANNGRVGRLTTRFAEGAQQALAELQGVADMSTVLYVYGADVTDQRRLEIPDYLAMYPFDRIQSQIAGDSLEGRCGGRQFSRASRVVLG